MCMQKCHCVEMQYLKSRLAPHRKFDINSDRVPASHDLPSTTLSLGLDVCLQQAGSVCSLLDAAYLINVQYLSGHGW